MGDDGWIYKVLTLSERLKHWKLEISASNATGSRGRCDSIERISGFSMVKAGHPIRSYSMNSRERKEGGRGCI